MAKQDAGGSDPLESGGAELEAQGAHVSEEVIWKARAEEAEEQVQELQSKLGELEMALGKAQETILHVERRGEIDRELTAAKAVDLETARLLTEAVIAEMDEPDVVLAVRELCDRKPFLFGAKRHAASGGVAMSPDQGQGGDEELSTIAQRAKSSGDRSELLRYLRARRVV